MSLLELGTHHSTEGSINFRKKRRDEHVLPKENAETLLLREYAERTHQSLELLRDSTTGWIADKITWSPEYAQEAINGELTHARISTQTSPTNLGLDFLNRQAAVKLKLMSQKHADDLDRRSLQTLERADKINGLFVNWYDSHTGQRLTHWPEQNDDGKYDEINPFVSTADNGNLKLYLFATAEYHKGRNPELAEQAERIAKGIDLSLLYDACDEPTDQHTGQLFGGAFVDFEKQTLQLTPWHYGLLTEARNATYAGILDGSLPPEHYYQIYRTLPERNETQNQKPNGETVIYSLNGKKIEVYEGHYQFQNGRAIPIIPTNDGSVFEKLLSGITTPEYEWGSNSWKIDYDNYIAAMKYHKINGIWGISPATNPDIFNRGNYGYETWGIPELSSHDQKTTHTGLPRDNVISPHATVLALDYDPEAVMENLALMRKEHPKIYGKYGFFDSLNPRNGKIAYTILSLDNGMLLPSIANHLTHEVGGCIRKPLRNRLEETVKPLIEQERFSLY